MRTVRCSSRLPGGGGCLPGVSAWGGLPSGVSAGGGGGVCQGGWVVSARGEWGGVCPGGVSQHALGRGGCLPQCMLAYTPLSLDRNLDTRLWKHYLSATQLHFITFILPPCPVLRFLTKSWKSWTCCRNCACKLRWSEAIFNDTTMN